MLLGKCEGDHVADVVRDDVGMIDLETVEHPGNIARLVHLGKTIGGLGRKTEAAKVGNDDRVITHQIGGKRRPHVAGLAIAVKQDDSGT